MTQSGVTPSWLVMFVVVFVDVVVDDDVVRRHVVTAGHVVVMAYHSVLCRSALMYEAHSGLVSLSECCSPGIRHVLLRIQNGDGDSGDGGDCDDVDDGDDDGVGLSVDI